MKRLLIAAVLLGLLLAGAAAYFIAAWTAPGPAGPRVLLIEPGAHVHALTRRMEAEGLVRSGLLFEAELRLRRLAEKLKAGEYAVRAHASMADIAAILVAGKSIQHKLTAAEGLTSKMIYDLVKADPVLVGDPGPVPQEGTLLPETYLFIRGETRKAMLARMAKAQRRFLAAAWAARAPGLPFATPREAVIMASIVEKETALPDERRHIAGVFNNRLKLGMRLQSDPTIIYGLNGGYPLGRGIRQSEIAGATLYNTYVIAGLPPGPICNPGKDSIAAVLNPAATDDLYFVASGAGGHVFAATMAEHLKNVSALRASERRREAGEARAAPPARKRGR
jgi:UPF0755 protein